MIDELGNTYLPVIVTTLLYAVRLLVMLAIRKCQERQWSELMLSWHLKLSRLTVSIRFQMKIS